MALADPDLPSDKCDDDLSGSGPSGGHQQLGDLVLVANHLKAVEAQRRAILSKTTLVERLSFPPNG